MSADSAKGYNGPTRSKQWKANIIFSKERSTNFFVPIWLLLLWGRKIFHLILSEDARQGYLSLTIYRVSLSINFPNNTHQLQSQNVSLYLSLSLSSPSPYLPSLSPLSPFHSIPVLSSLCKSYSLVWCSVILKHPKLYLFIKINTRIRIRSLLFCFVWNLCFFKSQFLQESNVNKDFAAWGAAYHSVAYLLLTQQPRVQFSAFPRLCLLILLRFIYYTA